MSWRTLLTVILLAAAIASGWSVWRRAQPAHDNVLRTRSDYLLRDYQITVLDKQGKESFTLQGPLLQRSPGDKTMDLITPKFLVPDRQGHYWQVVAERGLVPADGSKLTLQGKVLANSPRNLPPATRIETDQLTLLPEQQRATSHAAVTITRPGLTMRGIGLEADFDRQRVSLLSQVHTRYVPQH